MKRFLTLFFLSPIISFGMTAVPNIYVQAFFKSIAFNNTTTATAPLQIISKKQIQQSGAQNIQQLLEFAGLQVQDITGDSTSPTVSMRGFGDNAAQNTLILLNGQPLINPDLGSYDFNQLPINLIQHIEIIDGSAGVTYGDQAVGGVINLVTRPINTMKPYVTAGYGSYHAYDLYAGLSKKIHSWNYRLNGTQYNTDNYREHNALRNSHIDIAGNQQHENTDVNLEYQGNYQHQQYAGALTHEQVVENRRQPENWTDFNAQTDQLFQTTVTQFLQKNWKLSVDALGSTMKGNGILTNDYDNNRYQLNLTPTLKGIALIHQYEMFPTIGIALNKGRYHFDSSSYDSTSTQTQYAGFAQINFPLWTRWNLITGARYALAESDLNSTVSDFFQDTQATNRAFITTADLGWQINDEFRAFLRRAGNYRFPTTDENINTNTGKPLKTQIGVSYETGLYWNKPQWNGLVSLYQLDLNDEITAIPIPNSQTTFDENQNLKSTRRNGFAINTTYQIIHPLGINAVYRYVDTQFTSGPDKGNPIPFVSKQNVSLNLVYHPTSAWILSAGGLYLGKRPFANDPEERSPLMGGYTLLNAHIGYHFYSLHTDLRLNNITNKKYYAYAFDEYNGNQTTSYFYPAPSFNMMLNFTLDLD